MSRAPQGRGEFLQWINTCCGAHYASVESLADGILYNQLLETLVRKAAQSFRVLNPSDTAGIEQYEKAAKLAEQLLAKVHFGPRGKEEMEENLHVLHDCLRRCVLPRKVSTEMKVERLAEGKLQDHMLFLQWLYQHTQRVHQQIQKAAAPDHQQQQQQQPAHQPKRAASAGAAQRKPSAAAAAPVASSARGQTTESRGRAQFPVGYNPLDYSHNTSSSGHSGHDDDKGGVQHVSELELAAIVGELQMVEERLVKTLKRPARHTDSEEVDFASLQELLMERDTMWQSLAFVAEVVEGRCAQVELARRQGRANDPSAIETPLLRELRSIFTSPISRLE